jgi:tRNA threonylcarbamoyl adenosine modification protein (Sua5/YciO/YrdC/YwlC family)
MPEDDVALALLSEVGPMAVTSANLTGQPPATTVVEAATQLGAAVSVYLDGGPATGTEVSTILDCTGDAPVVLRAGAISQEQIDEVLSPDPPETTTDDAIELPADPTDESTLQETTDER